MADIYLLSNSASTSLIPSSAATTNATSAVAGPKILAGIICRNTTGASVFIKIYDKATAPTPGTDTPFLNIEIPPNTAFDREFNCKVTLGIGYAMTSTGALNISAAVTAGAITGFNLYWV